MNNILIVHRQTEIDDYINIAKKMVKEPTVATSLKEDERIFYTIDRSSWLRDCASGYDMYGQPRYDGYLIVSPIVDKVELELLRLVDGLKPIWYTKNGKVIRLSSLQDLTVE